MHFPIICLESYDIKVEDFEINLPYEDACLNEHCDYYGEIYDSEERRRVITSEWFKNLFAGYADVDIEKETITFRDNNTVYAVFSDYLKQLTETLYEKACKGELSGYEMHIACDSYDDCMALFFMNHDYCGYGKTSFDLLDDAKLYAGQTFRIGNVFDAHI